MKLTLPENRALDVLCLGRAGVDLYANERDTDFNEVSGFTKYVGGSAGNIAVALARLDCKVGFVSALSKDMLGDYVRYYLDKEGVNLDGIQTSPEGTRTSLALTELKAEGCGVVIYRNEAADFYLDKDSIDPAYIGSAKMLVVTGTALAQNPSQESTLYAMEQARALGTLVVLDIDYRAYSWESLDKAAEILRQAANLSDIIVGNREEFEVITTGTSIDTSKDMDAAFAHAFLGGSSQGNTQVVVVKAGGEGSRTYTTDGGVIEQEIFPVNVVKPFGAGDSFMGALLSTVIQGGTLEQGLENGAASASINVSSDNCTGAMPKWDQLKSFIAQAK